MVGDYENVRLPDKGRMLEASFILGEKIHDQAEEKGNGFLLNQPDTPKKPQADSLTNFIRQKNMSAGIVMIVGISIIVNTLVSAKTILINL